MLSRRIPPQASIPAIHSAAASSAKAHPVTAKIVMRYGIPRLHERPRVADRSGDGTSQTRTMAPYTHLLPRWTPAAGILSS